MKESGPDTGKNNSALEDKSDKISYEEADVTAWVSKDYYERLNLTYDASENDIKLAHRALSKRYHPDLSETDPNLRKNYEEIQKLLSEAYSTLKDSKKRKAYDQRIHQRKESFDSVEKIKTYDKAYQAFKNCTEYELGVAILKKMLELSAKKWNAINAFRLCYQKKFDLGVIMSTKKLLELVSSLGDAYSTLYLIHEGKNAEADFLASQKILGYVGNSHDAYKSLYAIQKGKSADADYLAAKKLLEYVNSSNIRNAAYVIGKTNNEEANKLVNEKMRLLHTSSLDD